ncbi:hypothetical protein DFJ73DRAFT_899423, partial [Zopfochytrium polystomum]
NTPGQSKQRRRRRRRRHNKQTQTQTQTQPQTQTQKKATQKQQSVWRVVASGAFSVTRTKDPGRGGAAAQRTAPPPKPHPPRSASQSTTSPPPPKLAPFPAMTTRTNSDRGRAGSNATSTADRRQRRESAERGEERHSAAATPPQHPPPPLREGATSWNNYSTALPLDRQQQQQQHYPHHQQQQHDNTTTMAHPPPPPPPPGIEPYRYKNHQHQPSAPPAAALGLAEKAAAPPEPSKNGKSWRGSADQAAPPPETGGWWSTAYSGGGGDGAQHPVLVGSLPDLIDAGAAPPQSHHRGDGAVGSTSRLHMFGRHHSHHLPPAAHIPHHHPQQQQQQPQQQHHHHHAPPQPPSAAAAAAARKLHRRSRAGSHVSIGGERFPGTLLRGSSSSSSSYRQLHDEVGADRVAGIDDDDDCNAAATGDRRDGYALGAGAGAGASSTDTQLTVRGGSLDDFSYLHPDHVPGGGGGGGVGASASGLRAGAGGVSGPSKSGKAKAPPLAGTGRAAAELPTVLVAPEVRDQLAALKPHRPYFLGFVTAVQVATLAASLYLNYRATGAVIQTAPQFNYLIGPAPGVLIHMGARFTPCMRPRTALDVPGAVIVCPAGSSDSISNSNSTTVIDPTTGLPAAACTLQDICGMSRFGGGGVPDQWYRFVTPLFLHGGVLHLALNLLFQVRTGFQMERDFGGWRIGVIYVVSGIGGFVFGGNYGGLTPSVGCSGALFGLVACLLIDLIQNWSLIIQPKRELAKLVFTLLLSFFLGTLPFVDGFAHLGGFFCGLLAGLAFMPTIHYSKRDGRWKLLMRVLAVPALVAVFVMMLRGFYDDAARTGCVWCRYLSCIPGMPWCEEKWREMGAAN